ASIFNLSADQSNSVPASIVTGVQISWSSTSGAQEQVQRATSGGGPWSDFGGIVAGVSGTTTTFDAASYPFYRVLEITTGGGGDPISNGGFEAGTATTNATDWNLVSDPTGLRPTRSTNAHTGSFSLRAYSQTDPAGPAHT